MNLVSSKQRSSRSGLFSKSQAGFTIIELMVTLGIVVFATGLVMVRYASFNSSVLLNSLAYQIAFDLRETQSLAVSVRGSDAVFNEEYGMHFDITTPNQYILFQDTNQSVSVDGYILYEESQNEAVGQPIIVDPRFTIVDVCGTSVGGARNCYNGVEEGVSGSGFPEEVTAAFARPDFDAVMYGEGIGALSSAEIILGANDTAEVTRKVLITANGQITVE